MATTGNTSESAHGGWREWSRSHRVALSVLTHAGLFALAWLLAFGLAYNFQRFSTWFFPFFLQLLIPVVVIKLSVFVVMGLHKGWWQYVGLRDVWKVTQATWISFFLTFVF